MSTLTPADALRLAINVLRDSAETRRMPSGLELQGGAVDMHADAADLLESLLADVGKFEGGAER
jgi:hypothetical protein